MVKYEATPGQQGQGLDESQVRPASGLRIASAHYVIPRQSLLVSTFGASQVIGSTAIGGTSGASVLTWTSLRGATWLGYMPCPATPQVMLICAASTFSLRLRMSGVDQFGEHIVETTPWMSRGEFSTANAYLATMSKVFSYVEDVEYQSISIDIASSLMAVGLTGIASSGQIAVTTELYDGSNASLLDDLGSSLGNWGLGTPLRIHAYSSNTIYEPPSGDTTTKDADPWKDQELLHFGQVILRNYDGVTATEKNLPFIYKPLKSILAASVDGSIGTRLGYSVSGWQGTPHKVGVAVGSDMVTAVSDVEWNGSHTAAHESSAGVGDVIGDMNADDREVFMVIRSGLGTSRFANKKSSYPV